MYVKTGSEQYNLTDYYYCFYYYSISSILKCTFPHFNISQIQTHLTTERTCRGFISGIVLFTAARKIMVHLIIAGFLGSVVYSVFTAVATSTPTTVTTLKLDLLGSGVYRSKSTALRAPITGAEYWAQYRVPSTVAQSSSHKMTCNFPGSEGCLCLDTTGNSHENRPM